MIGNYCSIRGLSSTEKPKNKKSINIRNVNYDAGADVLHRFQLQWNELHELAEENAGKAQEADTLISSIYEKLQHEWNSITCLNSTLAYIPKINNAIQDLMDQIGSLIFWKDMILKYEKSFLKLFVMSKEIYKRCLRKLRELYINWKTSMKC